MCTNVSKLQFILISNFDLLNFNIRAYIYIVVIMHVITRNDEWNNSTAVYIGPHCIYRILADYKISCTIVTYNSNLIQYFPINDMIQQIFHS